MWRQDKLGNLTEFAGSQRIKLNYETNRIRFILQKTEGFIYGYVVGDFNAWKKTEEYKLNWVADHNNGYLNMIKDHTFSAALNAGEYEYSYILVDIEGNEFLLSASKQSFKAFSFNWVAASHDLMIKASENVLRPQHALDLIAIQVSTSNRTTVAEVEWSVNPPHPALSIRNERLYLSEVIPDLTSITVSCRELSSGITTERSFNIVSEPLKGKLVHFIHPAGSYKGDNYAWDLWAYSSDVAAKSLPLLDGSGDLGVTAATSRQQVIARKKIWDMSWHNDWAEQTNSFELTDSYDNYYIIYGDNQLYTNLHDVITRTNPRILYAVMDDNEKIRAYLSHEPLIDTNFELYLNSIKQCGVNVIVKDEQKIVIFTNLPTSLEASDLVEIRASNTFLPCKVTLRGYLDNFKYSGDDMGIVFFANRVAFRIWAPSAQKVEVLLYANAPDKHALNLADQIIELHHISLSGTHQGEVLREPNINSYYMYRLYFADIDKNGCAYTRVTYACDPYAPALSVNGEYGVIADLNDSETIPDGWRDDSKPPLARKEAAIIYEMHLRDFTIAESSNIPAQLRGKYLGAVSSGAQYSEPGSTSKISTGIDSLVELGISHVHILPFFDYSSVDETRLNDPLNRNWGYDPQNYNAPEGSYSVDPYAPLLRIRETRSMVHGFHKRGIRVVMDMVYNHMSDTRNLDNIVPGYYFRSDYLGRYTNGSGCGNELASERPMIRKFILDSVKHWINDYRIDGLRFDLMELMDFETMKQIEELALKLDPQILIYGEPWKGGDSPLTSGTYRGCQKYREFAIFNDFFRDTIRGNNNPGNGFINGDPHNPLLARNMLEGLKGSINGLTSKPREGINYIDAHDNYTLWDHIEKSQLHSLSSGYYRQNLGGDLFENTLVRQNLLALAIIFTAQGIPFIHSGAEMLRTKQGDHNSYKSSDEVNALRWEDKANFKPIFDYLRGLIELRKAHPAFTMTDRDTINNHLSLKMAHDNEKSGVIIAHFHDFANGDEWKDLVVVYNASAIDTYEINNLLPRIDGNVWHIVADHQAAGTATLASVPIASVPPLRSHSIMILHS